MSKQKQTARNWKEIKQAINPRTLSKQGRARRTLFYARIAGLVFAVGLAAWGIYRGASAWEAHMREFRSAGDKAAVREVILITDGVLTQAWVEEALDLPAGAGLMDLDLTGLQDRLLGHGQVRTAVLTRQFPDTLVVNVQERLPVLRLLADVPGEGRKILLVSRDGVVFSGVGYRGLMVSYLPYLDGISLRRKGGGYAVIEGMEWVADLMQIARLEAPHLYRDWQVISLERLDTFDEILVRSRDVPRITFHRRDDYRRQLAQLDYVLDAMRAQAAAPESVDLSLGRQVAVEFGPPRSLSQPNLRHQQRTTRRDL